MIPISVGHRTLLAKTCLICGVLKGPEQYSLVVNGYYDSFCKECHNAYTTPRMREYQEKALKAAVNHYNAWTDEELKRLSQMTSEGRTGPQIAFALNRTVYSVYTMRSKLKEKQ